MRSNGAPRYEWKAMGQGARAAFCLAGLVMACSFIGYGAFLNSLEFPLLPGLFTNLAIWALPGQVVFVDQWHQGAAWPVIALAVSVTAVRLLPMVILVLSQARLPGAGRWPEFLVAHLTAVTIWVLANQRIDTIARPRRLPWMLGLGITLMLTMFGFTALGFWLADSMPLPVAAAMVFFTPAFFMLALFGGARWRFDYWAIALGAAIGPVATMLTPQFDLLIAGLAGGTAAFLIARPGRRTS